MDSVFEPLSDGSGLGVLPIAVRKVRQYPKVMTPFVVWDGEGMTLQGRHEYVYFACFDGMQFRDKTNIISGLSTEDCFRLLFNTAKQYPGAVHVVYGGSYDANMMLRDVPENLLRELKETESCDWDGWKITYRPRKFFRLRRGHKSLTLWDVIGFFQSAFVTAAKQWVEDAESLAIIEIGKAQRSNFQPEDIATVARYCQSELTVFYKMICALGESLDELSLHLNRWDGAAAIASKLLQTHKVNQHMRRHEDSRFRHAVQCAYAGGRIELLQPGDHKCPIYHYDINSAYPSAMTLLPSLQWSAWTECTTPGCQTVNQYDLAHIEFNGEDADWPDVWPFFHRDKHGAISFPMYVSGWYWGPEVRAAQSIFGLAVNVQTHYHFQWLTERQVFPFTWVADRYQQRLEYKAIGSMLEKPLKLGMNSLYGKLAQQVGYDPVKKKKPKFHQLEWAGWITSHTRSRLFLAASQNPESIIAFETDGIYSLVPLDLPVSKLLGDWDSKIHSRLTYVQSGVYFADDQDEAESLQRYRGFDKGSLVRSAVLDGWKQYDRNLKKRINDPAKLALPLTRFQTLATSLIGERMDGWRQWKTDPRDLSLLPVGKRLHSMDCTTAWGEGSSHRTIALQPQETESCPYPIMWEDEQQRTQHQAFIDELAETQEEVLGYE